MHFMYRERKQGECMHIYAAQTEIIIDDVTIKTPFILPSSRASFTNVSEALSTFWLSQITFMKREVMLRKENIH